MSVNNNDPYARSIPNHAPTPYGYQGSHGWEQSRQSMEGTKAAQSSLILGVIGTATAFLVGWLIIGGPVALVLGWVGIQKANLAERHNVAATPGRVFSWISIVCGAMTVLGWLTILLIGAVGAASSSDF